MSFLMCPFCVRELLTGSTTARTYSRLIARTPLLGLARDATTRRLGSGRMLFFSLGDTADHFYPDDGEGDRDERHDPAAGEEWGDERDDE